MNDFSQTKYLSANESFWFTNTTSKIVTLMIIKATFKDAEMVADCNVELHTLRPYHSHKYFNDTKCDVELTFKIEFDE